MIVVMKMKKDRSSRFANALSLPPETLGEIPLVLLRGESSLSVENHRGIIAYGSDCVRVGLKEGSLSVQGRDLQIFSMTGKRLELRGFIRCIERE